MQSPSEQPGSHHSVLGSTHVGHLLRLRAAYARGLRPSVIRVSIYRLAYIT